MKSRLTYCQINDVIKEINKAVVSKYKILHQPKKSMSSVARNLYHRFIDEETKDTKGRSRRKKERAPDVCSSEAEKHCFRVYYETIASVFRIRVVMTTAGHACIALTMCQTVY
uniref:SKA complex subunit 1 n=1 Tax=Ursus americanus TaxID=9643 RepID=A0A452QFB7_URSAM